MELSIEDLRNVTSVSRKATTRSGNDPAYVRRTFGNSTFRPDRRAVLVLSLAMAMIAIVCFLRSSEAHVGSFEYEVKSAFLYNFMKFVDWPSGTFASPEQPIILGIVGEDPFDEVIDHKFAGRLVNGRAVVIRRISSLTKTAVSDLNVLFVSSSESRRLESVIDAVKTAGILTVGDTDGFAKRGVMINLRIVDDTVRFEVNLSAASNAKLSISARVLQLAAVVFGG